MNGKSGRTHVIKILDNNDGWVSIWLNFTPAL